MDKARKFDLVKDLNLFVRRLAWKATFSTKTLTDEERSATFFQQTSTRKADFQAISNLVELLNENCGPEDNIEFDYKLGEYVEVEYCTPENEPLPLTKKSTKFPQMKGFPHLVAFLQKMTKDLDGLHLVDVPEHNLSPTSQKPFANLVPFRM